MELFRTFDEQENPGPLVAREKVHRQGLWHKSVQVLVFNTNKEMLLQHRASEKDLYADLWDFSVGEHLLPDEDEHAGAIRGLLEELGVAAHALQNMGDPVRIECQGPGFLDREIQQSFCTLSDGPFAPDPQEVQGITFVSKSQLTAWVAASPADFTPWFLEQWSARSAWAERHGLFE